VATRDHYRHQSRDILSKLLRRRVHRCPNKSPRGIGALRLPDKR
jgi:hypothetical protein